MRVVASIIMGLLLFGCTSPLHPTLKKIDSIEPGVIKTASLGETMFETGYVRAMPGFIASANYYLPEMDHLVFPTVKKGSVWLCNGQLPDGNYLCVNPDITEKDVTTDTGKPVSTRLPLFIIKPWGEFHGLYYPETGRESEQVNRLHGLFVYKDVPLEDSYKARLLYSGKKDSAINLTYQEFNGTMKEPALSQVLSYEMTTASMINVKNVMIEVVDATEESIKYKVKN